MDAVAEYRKRRQQRLDARFHKDAPEEENQNNNNKSPSGGHGNTRLPFGLCHRYGIEIGKDWQPRDAWDALAEKGVTPASEFAKRSGSGTITTKSGATYSNLKSKKRPDGTYDLIGDFKDKTLSGKELSYTNTTYHTFLTKEEMFACLQENGISKFKDPDTGETVNPVKMKLPKTVAKVGKTRYTDIVLGTREHKSGRIYARRSFTITGKDFSGKKTMLKEFESIQDAKNYAKKIGCAEADLRVSPDFKRYASAKVG